MKASDLFVRALENEGVECIFALPGEENLDLIESLRTSKIEVIVTRHEQSAAFMAATYGRLTGNAGVCLATLGPGALNLVTGVAFAQLGGMPLVVITGQKAMRFNLQAQFQLIDVVGTFRPITKMVTSITDGRQIPKIVRQAFKTSEEEKPGAVHIELPEDVAKDEVTGIGVIPKVRVRRSSPDPKAIKQAINLLRKSRMPVVLVGSGGNRKLISKQLKNFVEATGIYVVNNQMGKGVFSEKHPCSLFSIGIHRKDYIHCGFDKADLIITVGYNTVEYPPAVWNPKQNKKILHLDFNSAQVEQNYNPILEVVGDISNSLWQLSEYFSKHKPKWDLDYFVKLRGFLVEKYQESIADAAYPLKPQRIVSDTRKIMGDEDILVLDNGIYKLWVARQYPAYAPNTVLLDNGLASMGGGLPNGIAAKILNPDKKVLVFTGDGGFMMNSQEMETAVRLGLNVVVLIWRDDAYGFIRWKQEGMGFKDFSVGYGNPNFVAYAESYGAKGFRVEKASDLVPMLKKAFKEGVPVIIDCPVDYSENSKVFTKELGELVCPI